VIDANAQAELNAHIEKMKASAKFIAAAPASKIPGTFVTPHLFEIDSIRVLEKEVFGPVLHLVRFKASERQRVADDINGTGFGLTFGMHSRIEDNIAFFTSRIHAGNHYINRSMTGAVVGVQPFGGEGLSGTGPKAGGPFYLLKFVLERTRTVNTAAIGGNVTLLAGNA
jgi:RHH-type proline utilization regulon transcriptional repressor/proline dehydrogenase/delta 1-pyrroline-5-carboxylate dehydrogenase